MSDQWKCGNEFLPYHRSASHVNPDHRDGWNACFAVARSRIEADEALMRDALEALIHHTEQTRPIHGTWVAITALRTRLETPK